jgi:hypothetical protein
LNREAEDDEAVPTVAAARLGVDGAGGAMAEQLTVVVVVGEIFPFACR